MINCLRCLPSSPSQPSISQAWIRRKPSHYNIFISSFKRNVGLMKEHMPRILAELWQTRRNGRVSIVLCATQSSKEIPWFYPQSHDLSTNPLTWLSSRCNVVMMVTIITHFNFKTRNTRIYSIFPKAKSLFPKAKKKQQKKTLSQLP